MSFLQKFKNPEFILTRLLQLIGVTLLLATLTIFLPVDWMAWTHDFLGVQGEFQTSGITIYLARSTSALYAIHGAVVLFLSFDVRKYIILIKAIGLTHILFGMVILGIDLTASMPWYWTLLEGAPVSMGGFVIFFLARSVPG